MILCQCANHYTSHAPWCHHCTYAYLSMWPPVIRIGQGWLSVRIMWLSGRSRWSDLMITWYTVREPLMSLMFIYCSSQVSSYHQRRSRWSSRLFWYFKGKYHFISCVFTWCFPNYIVHCKLPIIKPDAVAESVRAQASSVEGWELESQPSQTTNLLN